MGGTRGSKASSATGNAAGNAGDETGVTASRRQLLAMAAVGGVGAATVAGATPASAHDRREQHGKALGTTFRLTVLGTSDTHGNVLNWDYFKDAEYTDGAANDVGLAKISTLVTAMRQERGAASCLTLDAGDTIQGTPLSTTTPRSTRSPKGTSTRWPPR